MKPLFFTKTIVALAVAVVATTSPVNQAQGQPAAPAPAAAALPADVIPGSPLADVIKMVQAGVDASTIQGYIANCQSPFNLDADKILTLRDMGVPSVLINAMMDRDKGLYAASVAPPPAPVSVVSAPPQPVPAPEPAPMAAPVADDSGMAPPPADITQDYFNDALNPYGTWVQVDGYGRCWRPTTVIYNTAWSPYCDSGHWVYTDYGWYWDSDYSWGVTFHYGRWFRSPRFGWVWYPDTVWAPSWVAWRSGGDYCGWAPLPPFAVFRPGFGFFYRGVAVGVDFDFGLGADYFVFVSPDHFCDPHPRSYTVPRERLAAVFHQTTIINNYNVNNKTIVNRGISVDRITSVTHRPIQTVPLSTLPNAGHQGWRGAGYQQTLNVTRPVYNAGGNNALNRFNGNASPGGQQNSHPTFNGAGNNQVHPINGALNNQGEQGNLRPTEGSHSTVQNSQFNTVNHNQTQTFTRQPQPSQPGNTVIESSHVTPQNGLPPTRSVNQYQPNHTTVPVVPANGGTQFQERQNNIQTQPRPNYGESETHNIPAVPAVNPQGQQGQIQTHNGGGNPPANSTSGANNKSNPDKQNQ